MKPRTYGYARVSTRDQHESRQLDAFKSFGVPKRNIVVDKQSGKNFERPNYQRLVHGRLKTGDLLVVKSIDRLGRNYDEILEEWRFITKTVCANIVVMDMPLLDTRDEKGLLGTLIADLVLQLLSYVAQNERETLLQRQKEGIESAKARGVKFGRPSRPVSEDVLHIIQKWKCNEMPTAEAMKLTGLPRSSFYALAKQDLSDMQ